MSKHNFKAPYYHYKDQDTLIEQSPMTGTLIGQTPLTKYSKKAVTNICELGKCEQNWGLSSKIGHKK